MLVSDAEFVRFSPGDLMRSEIRSGSSLGRRLEVYVANGALVPDQEIFELFLSFMDSHPLADVVFDGFPRTGPQARLLLSEAGRLGVRQLAVVDISVEYDVLVSRICDRRVCSLCHSVFRRSELSTGETVCQSCGGPLVVRADDSEITFRQRFLAYEANKSALLDVFSGAIVAVDGDRDDRDVFSSVLTGISL